MKGRRAVYDTMEPTSEFPATDEEAEIPSTFQQATKTIFFFYHNDSFVR